MKELIEAAQKVMDSVEEWGEDDSSMYPAVVLDAIADSLAPALARAKEQAEAAVDHQEMIFALIRQGSFNRFDGNAVVDALKQHKELWEAVVFRDGNDSGYLLRDLPDEFHMDSLYIRASGKDDDALEQLMKELKADEVGWVEDSDTFRHLIRDRRVLRAWWD